MKSKILVILCFLLSIASTQLIGQKTNKKIVISGTVKDQNKNPVMNAIVLIDGNQSNIFTDQNGNFKVRVKPDAKRIGVVKIGGGLVEEDIAGRSQIELILKSKSAPPASQDLKSEEDLVNVGYDEVKRKNISTNISKVNSKGKKREYASIYDMLIEVPGVSVRNGNINIQNSGDILGDIPPLILVDGVVVENISYISVHNVEKIDVLKGSAATIYGTRAAGGVILITLKK